MISKYNDTQMNLHNIRRQLADAFDDDRDTQRWGNVVDHTILTMILISTIGIFLSTYKGVEQRYGNILSAIDIVTTIIFTIEVTIRLWVIDLINPKYRGFWGRIRYCFSFYGMIDILSTYPYYLHFIFPLPYTTLKALRIARLLRIFRYVKAFSVLRRAVLAKRDEMIVSLQFLSIITLLLSFILFYVEHEAQPEVYDNGLKSVVWAFAQYIGDPGHFAETPPITLVGRMIAVVIGVLGIAIFAVPAGLIGSAFSEVMTEDGQKKQHKELSKQLYNAFECKLDRPTGFQVVPRYVTFNEIQARLDMTLDEIIIAARQTEDFRIINLGSTRPIGSHTTDGLAIELCYRNTSYGCLIDRNSPITIVSPSNMSDPIIGHWAYYLAKIGGFNYIARETGSQRPYKSFYAFADESEVDNLPEYMADLRRLTNRPDAWCWTPLVSSGAQEPSYPTQFHFYYGGEKGDETYEGKDLLIQDWDTFKALYDEMTSELKRLYGYESDRQRYHSTATSNLFARKLSRHINTCILRVEWHIIAWTSQNIEVAKLIADLLNKHICGIEQPEYDAELKAKYVGYSSYSHPVGEA